VPAPHIRLKKTCTPRLETDVSLVAAFLTMFRPSPMARFCSTRNVRTIGTAARRPARGFRQRLRTIVNIGSVEDDAAWRHLRWRMPRAFASAASFDSSTCALQRS